MADFSPSDTNWPIVKVPNSSKQPATITDDQRKRLKEYFTLRYDDECDKKRCELMGKYARDVLEMTSNHPGLKCGVSCKDDYEHLEDQIHSSSKFPYRHSLNEC